MEVDFLGFVDYFAREVLLRVIYRFHFIYSMDLHDNLTEDLAFIGHNGVTIKFFCLFFM